MHLRSALAIAAASSLLLLTACDTDDADQVDDVAAEVEVVDNAFEPPDVEVAVGDTVQWTHVGNLGHTVTFDDGPDSGEFSGGETFQHTFDESGEFDYVCTIHPGMTASVTVSG